MELSSPNPKKTFSPHFGMNVDLAVKEKNSHTPG